MKKLILFLSLIFLLTACGGTKNFDFPSAEVVMVSQDNFETMTLRSTGYGNDKDEALYNAEKLAFKTIFFRGIPNSNYTKPLIGIDEATLGAKHKTYLDRFFNERMRTFIVSSYQSTPFQKYKGSHSTTVDLKINFQSLKKDLEENGLIRKFGF